MNPDANNIYKIDDTNKRILWDNCIFVFDSSTLLNFYSVPKITREKIYANILTPHKGRFWIPAHVQFEFLKNREKVIGKPITDEYHPLQNVNLKKIKDSLNLIESQTSDLQSKIQNPDKHPHFDGSELQTFRVKTAEFKVILEDMTNAVIARINDAVEEIKKLPENDDVLTTLQNTLEVGPDYSFEQIYKITEEGKHRFQFSIPPGYKDLDDAEKKGTQIFGDLILWKQLLEYNKGAKKPIIFICDDLKEDWCHVEKRSGGEKRILMPREELIKEMYDVSGSTFWMYNLEQFVYLAKEYWDTTINETDIQNVAEAIVTRGQTQPIIELDIIKHGGMRSPMGYSDKNPVHIEEDGSPVILIGAGSKPIKHWSIGWRLEVRVFNNSSYPAYNIKIESIGEVHFHEFENLQTVNNIKPFEYVSLQAKFTQWLESVHTEADELMKYKIPPDLEGLLLRITCHDEKRNEYISHLKIEGNKAINF